MIAVCITTYNHESFIAQAIESVLAQRCDTPMRIYIGDDASTDSTAAICAHYAATDSRIIYVRHERNIGLVNNTLDLYRRLMADGCEWVAMLDGDDYWTAPHKLQTQTDYLRNHPEYGFIHTAAYEDRQGQLVLNDKETPPTGDLRLRYNLSGARQTNCTVLFRSCLLQEEMLSALQEQDFPVLDYPLYGLLAQHTFFAYLPTPTAAWRKHISVSNPVSWRRYTAYKKERIRMWKWLDKMVPNTFHFSLFRATIWYFGQLVSFFL